MPMGIVSASFSLKSIPNMWHAATRPCSIEVAARAGKPMQSPAA